MKFGILCNGIQFQQWQLDAIRILVSGGHECSLRIVNANPAIQQNFMFKLLHYPYSKLLIRIWFRFVIKPKAKNSIDADISLMKIPEIRCATTRKGYAEYFQQPDIEYIRSFNLDFILRFGFGILKGEIMESAKYGIWSYHHDDDRKYRGVPTGFWEIWFNDPINAAILQRLTNQLDSGIILRKSYFSTIDHSWESNLDKLLKSTVEWPLQVCTDIENGNTGFLEVKNTPGTAIYKLPGNFKMLRFLLKLLVNKLQFHFHDLFLTEKWNIGIVSETLDDFLKPGEITLNNTVWLNINTQKSVYHADSFGFIKNDQIHILCEEYDYKNAKGFLTSFSVDKSSFRVHSKTKALEKEYHLAYPYLFEYQGSHYCIPENSEGGSVDLYWFEPDEGKLIFEQNLIKNLQAVDPSLFFYNGYWWLFFTDRISTNERLHIWYSKHLSGPYTSHSNNPVKVDIRSSRPAGNPFVYDGKLFRPAQDCSIRSGRRIYINEIIALTPTTFVETEFSIINPGHGSKFRDGLHTICVTNGLIVVDGKRECFIWYAFARKLSQKITKLIKK